MRSSLRIGVWCAAFLVAWVPARAGAQAVDLTVSAFSGAPATATQGQAFAVSSTVRTTGAVNRSFTVGFYLSADRTITTADALIGSRTVASLPRNGTSTATTAVRVEERDRGVSPGHQWTPAQ